MVSETASTEDIVTRAHQELMSQGVKVGPLAEAASGRSRRVKVSDRLLSLVDLTLLKEDATQMDIIKLCNKAKADKTRSVCVRENFAELAKEKLKGYGVKLCVVSNFPVTENGTLQPGGHKTKAEAVAEIKSIAAKAVDEIDTVMPLHLFRAGKYDQVKDYLRSVIQAAGDIPVKVILETATLAPEDIAKASLIAKAAGASFVKTSTGFAPEGGASAEAVAIMRRSVGPDVGVKASGGIKTYEQAMAVIEAGADVIGASGMSLAANQQRVPPNALRVHILPQHKEASAGMGY